jgi:hypothetical protein
LIHFTTKLIIGCCLQHSTIVNLVNLAAAAVVVVVVVVVVDCLAGPKTHPNHSDKPAT